MGSSDHSYGSSSRSSVSEMSNISSNNHDVVTGTPSSSSTTSPPPPVPAPVPVPGTVSLLLPYDEELDDDWTPIVQDKNMEFIWWIANRLTSYDEEMHKEILDDFFTADATYIHPALTIVGRYNIRKVFRVWTSLNKDEPEVTNIVFDGHTAIISLVQNMRPRLFPLIHLQIPATTTLLFQDSPIGPMIYSQQDSWTLEGIVQSMPLLGWWYDNVVRNLLGAVLTSAGGFLHTANQTTGYLQFRAEEVQKLSTEIIEKSSAEIQQRSRDMTLRAQTIVDQAKVTVEQRVATAREEVERMRQMMRSQANVKAITGSEKA
ncbi:hypothetical protein BG006_008050 [Podila minutissima]|uniref:SigF-like NTF2-like domain-containing protein n=1 Tax=Podila minutissima TaxID=64525 RepID=A0A9P5VKA8_9FUNG|nr:hypothetical protein BG006_008050 [Podila minutissima]